MSEAKPASATPEALSRHPLAALSDPATIRARCAAVLRAAENNDSPNFTIARTQLPLLAERVAALALKRFPGRDQPVHSCWRHFEAGGVARTAELDAALAGRSPDEAARARFDLAVLTALLDAPPGPQWSFSEQATMDKLALPAQRQDRDQLMAMLDQAAGGRSDALADPAPAPQAGAGARLSGAQGLGVACFRAFMAGVFSADPADPLRADAATLKLLDGAALRAVFQTSPANALVGLDARATLLNRLGQTAQDEARNEGIDARAGLLCERLTHRGRLGALTATELLGEVLRSLTPIWSGLRRVQHLPAGDIWPHHWAGGEAGTEGAQDSTSAGYVALHRPALWLSYSLLEPLQSAGLQVSGVCALPGLADSVHGALMLDSGVIVPRHASDLGRSWKLHDEFVVEWRALTLALLEALAAGVRERLASSAEQLPLARLLETSSALGHEIASGLRGGAPPFAVESDGTLY